MGRRNYPTAHLAVHRHAVGEVEPPVDHRRRVPVRADHPHHLARAVGRDHPPRRGVVGGVPQPAEAVGVEEGGRGHPGGGGRRGFM